MPTPRHTNCAVESTRTGGTVEQTTGEWANPSEEYRHYQPPIPGGRASEVQVMAGHFVRNQCLWWREDAESWWQLCNQAQNAATEAAERGWIERSQGEVRAFVFGYLAGCAVQGGRAARARLADNVLREAKLLAWPHGSSARNDLTAWARRNVRPADFGVGDLASEDLVARYLAENPEAGQLRRRSLEMQLAGAMREAWSHEPTVRQTNALVRQDRRVRGWIGIVLTSK